MARLTSFKLSLMTLALGACFALATFSQGTAQADQGSSPCESERAQLTKWFRSSMELRIKRAVLSSLQSSPKFRNLALEPQQIRLFGKFQISKNNFNLHISRVVAGGDQFLVNRQLTGSIDLQSQEAFSTLGSSLGWICQFRAEPNQQSLPLAEVAKTPPQKPTAAPTTATNTVRIRPIGTFVKSLSVTDVN